MAVNPQRIAGTAYLSVDGISYMLAGSFAYSPSKFSRETMIGMDGIHGFSEKPNAGHVSATLRDAGGLSLAALNQMANVTVICTLANGKTVVARNAWTVETQEAKAEDATVEVRWESADVSEQ